MNTRRLDFRWPLLAHPFAVALGVIVLLGVLRAVVNIHDVLLMGFFALLLAVVFSFPVNFMARRLPRGLAVLITLVLSLGLVVGLAVLAYPMMAKQLGALVEQLPDGLEKAQHWLQGRDGSPVGQLPQPQKKKVEEHVQARVGEMLGAAVAKIVPAAMTVSELLITTVLLVILAAFLVYEPRTYQRGLRKLLPQKYEAVFDECWRRLAHDLRHWVGGTMVSMLIMGTFTAVALSVIGVEGWFVLGMLTFFGTFVPYLGAISSAVPGLIVALAQSPGTFLAGCGVYLAVHVLEGYLVQPFVMRRAVEIRPALLLFGQACLGAVFGIMGVIVATPLMVCGQTLVQYLWVERRLGKGDAPAGEPPSAGLHQQ